MTLPTELIANAKLVAPCIEALFLGVFGILCPLTIWVLMFRGRSTGRSKVAGWMVAITIVMFLLATAHFALDLVEAIRAFVTLPRKGIDGDRVWQEAAFRVTYPAKPILLTMLTTAGDSFMAYRAFIVWNRNKWILSVEIFLLLGCLGKLYSGFGGKLLNDPCVVAGGVFWAVTLDSFTADFGDLETFTLSGLLTFLPLSLVTNIVTTSLLLGRLYIHRRRTFSLHSSYSENAKMHWRVMKTILLSEAIYSAALIVSIMAPYLFPLAADIILDILPPIVGICFTLIIIGVGLNEPGEGARVSDRPRSSGRPAGRSSGQIMPLVDSSASKITAFDGAGDRYSANLKQVAV
ncbi:hypothetical protein C8Q79DRAFT_1012539 [Trametes meyenii]|nr:hypothetical protein C8Q79DRAFT_1012539 [Trametes meyenii]